MQIKPLLNLHNNQVSSVNTSSKKLQSKSSQHVFQISSQSPEHSQSHGDKCRSYLVDLPDESLGHIITYLDTPSSLIAISQVNRKLRSYVTDDNTWYRSFVYHYWGIGPECYPTQGQKVMLRRSENTWKNEFTRRYEFLLRWEKSRSAMMSYQPHSWSTSNMHLMDNMSLMTTNLQYGIVARSFPLTGKILRGFLDASGTANGFGIGNPNVEFSPHVSCIAVSSRGGTALVAWGFRSGEIALTTAPRVMDSDRPAARYLRSHAQDEHPSQIQSLIFSSAGSGGDDEDLIFSGCARGQVKAWDSKRLRCLWSGSTNEDERDTGVPDPCVKLAFLATTGVLVAVCQSGDLVVWSGFQVYRDNSGGYLVHVEEKLRIFCPSLQASKTVTSLHVDPESDTSKPILLVHYVDDKSFFRYDINTSSACTTIVRSRFGVDAEESFPITSLKPCFVTNKESSNSATTVTSPTGSETISSALSIHLASSHWATKRAFPFILTGDSLGNVHVWNWDVRYDVPPHGISSNDNNNDGSIILSDALIRPFRTWEAYGDGAVSSLEVNEYIIVTGSSNGCIKVWDVLTLGLLRVFPLPTTRPPCNGPVGQIFVRDDLLIANIGARVLVWQAKPVAANKKIKVKRSGKPKGRGVSTAMSRWQQQMEFLSDIKETKQDLEAERAHVNRVSGRLRAEQMSLDGLGLTEAEAVEYLLMLSREEEETRAASELASSSSPSSSPSPALVATPPSSNLTANTGILDTVFILDGVDDDDEQPSVVPSAAAPNESGQQRSDRITWSTTSTSTSTPSDDMSISSSFASSPDVHDEFPSIGSSPSGIRMHNRTETEGIQLAGSWSRGSPIRSWQRRSSSGVGIAASPSLSASVTTASSYRSQFALSSSPSRSATGASTVTGATLFRRTRDEEDAELKFVLELSLAEARSRGEI